MTSESVVEAEWVLKGYWTRIRFPFQTRKGGWSDVDVLSYDPEIKHLVVSESKVRGPKNTVHSYTEYTESKCGNIFESKIGHYFSFINHLPMLCQDGIIFDHFRRSVKKVTVQLVSNCVVAESVRDKVIKQLIGRVKKRLPNNLKVECQIDTTVDVFARIIQLQHKSNQGRRYGHPIIDLARELNRYIYPSVKSAGRLKISRKDVRNESLHALEEAMRAKFA